MKKIKKKSGLSELLIFPLQAIENKKRYFSVKPTICLISGNQHFNKEKIATFIKKMIEKGCVFFLFWGNSADELHDLADEMIERENMLNVVTTSHKDENAKDIAYFLLKATFFETCPHRFLVFLDETEERNKLLISELLELTKTWE